ncbi:MAG: hypothetical protein COC00_008370 [Rhizobiales bacterium]|nr:hypothetical protein [Hyphomicrobiales bacterium]
MRLQQKIVLFALSFTGASLVVLQTLVYNGFCVAERRWLGEQEMFDIAKQRVFEHYPPQSFRVPGVFSKKIERHVQYKDFDDFVNRNPNCCRLSQTGWKGLSVDFIYRLRGYSAGFVRVEYAADADKLNSDAKSEIAGTVAFFKARGKEYVPNKGNLSFVPLDNCGNVWQGF